MLLWEVASLARTPYGEFSNIEAFHAILNGYRLPRVPLCTDTTYAIMDDCWQHEPEMRPSFSAILQRLQHTGAAPIVEEPEPLDVDRLDEAGYVLDTTVQPNGTQSSALPAARAGADAQADPGGVTVVDSAAQPESNDTPGADGVGEAAPAESPPRPTAWKRVRRLYRQKGLDAADRASLPWDDADADIAQGWQQESKEEEEDDD